MILMVDVDNCTNKISKTNKLMGFGKNINLKKLKTLSVCMIVKNEENLILDCIKNIEEYVDEIIIVDTGSNDRTVEIAKYASSKVKLFNFKWVDDFSAARNFSISKATGDWILILDPDEVLLKHDLKKINSIIQSTVIVGFQLIQRTYTNNSDQASWKKALLSDLNVRGFLGYFDVPITRLFENKPEFSFTGRVHEDITPSIKSNKLPLLKSDLIIHHYEYSRGRDFVEDKQLYYLELTLKKIKDQPKDPKAYSDAGLIYLTYKSNLDKALYYFKKALEVDPYHKVSYNAISKILMKKGKKQEAVDILKKSVELGLRDVTAHLNLAKIYSFSGDLDAAIKLLQQSLLFAPNSFASISLLANFHSRREEYHVAIDLYNSVINLKSHDSNSYMALAKLYEKTNQNEKAIKFYRFLIQNNHPQKQIFIEKILDLEQNL